MTTLDAAFGYLDRRVNLVTSQAEKDYFSLSEAIIKIENSNSENTPLMIYKPLSKKENIHSMNGYAIFGVSERISPIGPTSKERSFVDIQLIEGTKFGFLYESKDSIKVYGIPNNTLHVTADFEIFVGKEEIMTELKQLDIECELIQECLDSIGLQNAYFW